LLLHCNVLIVVAAAWHGMHVCCCIGVAVVDAALVLLLLLPWHGMVLVMAW